VLLAAFRIGVVSRELPGGGGGGGMTAGRPQAGQAFAPVGISPPHPAQFKVVHHSKMVPRFGV
jgi:hypothetical protein